MKIRSALACSMADLWKRRVSGSNPAHPAGRRVKGPATMRFKRRKRVVSFDFSERSNFGAGRASMVAGIYTITKETVHKTIFALMGQAVLSGALPCLAASPRRVLYSRFQQRRTVKVFWFL